MAMPPRKPRRWTREGIAAEVEAEYELVIRRLYSLPMRILREAEDGTPAEVEPVTLDLTPEAEAVWAQFFEAHAEAQAGLGDEDLEAAYAKLEGGAARLALLLECVTWAETAPVDDATGPKVVSAASMLAGVTLARWFAREAERVYRVLRESPEARIQREDLEWIASHGGQATPSELAHGPRRYRGKPETAEAALTLYAKAGLGSWEVRPSPGGRGPAARVFVLGVARVQGSEDSSGETRNPGPGPR